MFQHQYQNQSNCDLKEQNVYSLFSKWLLKVMEELGTALESAHQFTNETNEYVLMTVMYPTSNALPNCASQIHRDFQTKHLPQKVGLYPGQVYNSSYDIDFEFSPYHSRLKFKIFQSVFANPQKSC